MICMKIWIMYASLLSTNSSFMHFLRFKDVFVLIIHSKSYVGMIQEIYLEKYLKEILTEIFGLTSTYNE